MKEMTQVLDVEGGCGRPGPGLTGEKWEERKTQLGQHCPTSHLDNIKRQKRKKGGKKGKKGGKKRKDGYEYRGERQSFRKLNI